MEGAGKLAAEMRDAESQEFDDDPWSRSTYTPKKEFSSKVVVWKKKPAEYYKFKYSWLPQPMLRNGVLSIYPDKRKDEYKDDSAQEQIIASTMSPKSEWSKSTNSESNSGISGKKRSIMNIKGRGGAKIAPSRAR